MKTMNKFKKYSMIPMLAAAALLTSCEKEEDEVPDEEHDHEVITNVHLVFTNVADANDVVEAEAEDSDGEGVGELEVLDTINLDAGKTYELTFEILNEHHDEDEDEEEDEDEHEGEDIGAEIADEADEHQVFFGFTNNAFTNPTGEGNIDDAAGEVNYNDEDANGNPLGLSTNWTTGSASDGKFRVVLMHQPDGIKSANSTAQNGDADFDLEFDLKINGLSVVLMAESSVVE